MSIRLVALWRGINVGRNKRVAMADLRALLRRLGYDDVVTHLQSGNAVFSSAGVAPTAVASDIRHAVATELGVDAAVVLRTAAEMRAIVSRDPLLEMMNDPSKHLVGFLSEAPDPAGVGAVAALDLAPDIATVVGRELYLWCPNGIADSAFVKVKWDRHFGADVTMRNWNTVTRLAAIANG